MKFQNKYKRLQLNYKAGFRNVTGKRVLILDSNYKEFYDSDKCQHKVWNFNLPAGTFYLAEGKLRQTMYPVEYALESLPIKEKHLRFDPEKFPVVYGENRFTGTVYWDPERSPYGKNVILFDKSMRYKSIPEQVFIYYHECGHRFWDNELACDIYASNRMLADGYNPSQIRLAIDNTLSDMQEHRKDFISQIMTNKEIA